MTLQLVGLQKSEIVSFSDIETARRRLQIDLPKDVNREGGSVEINIGGYYLPTLGAYLDVGDQLASKTHLGASVRSLSQGSPFMSRKSSPQPSSMEGRASGVSSLSKPSKRAFH